MMEFIKAGFEEFQTLDSAGKLADVCIFIIVPILVVGLFGFMILSR